MEYGFNCFAQRAARQSSSGLTKHLEEEEMGFLGREGLRETRMLASENLHEGTPRQLRTNNDQNTADSANNLKSAVPYNIVFFATLMV